MTTNGAFQVEATGEWREIARDKEGSDLVAAAREFVRRKMPEAPRAVRDALEDALLTEEMVRRVRPIIADHTP